MSVNLEELGRLLEKAFALVNKNRNQGYGSYGDLTQAENCLRDAKIALQTIARQQEGLKAEIECVKAEAAGDAFQRKVAEAQRDELKAENERLTTLIETQGQEIAHLDLGLKMANAGDLERARIEAEARAETAEAALSKATDALRPFARMVDLTGSWQTIRSEDYTRASEIVAKSTLKEQ